jgi:hypothetical protein
VSLKACFERFPRCLSTRSGIYFAPWGVDHDGPNRHGVQAHQDERLQYVTVLAGNRDRQVPDGDWLSQFDLRHRDRSGQFCHGWSRRHGSRSFSLTAVVTAVLVRLTSAHPLVSDRSFRKITGSFLPFTITSNVAGRVDRRIVILGSASGSCPGLAMTLPTAQAWV